MLAAGALALLAGGAGAMGAPSGEVAQDEAEPDIEFSHNDEWYGGDDEADGSKACDDNDDDVEDDDDSTGTESVPATISDTERIEAAIRSGDWAAFTQEVRVPAATAAKARHKAVGAARRKAKLLRRRGQAAHQCRAVLSPWWVSAVCGAAGDYRQHRTHTHTHAPPPHVANTPRQFMFLTRGSMQSDEAVVSPRLRAVLGF